MASSSCIRLFVAFLCLGYTFASICQYGTTSVIGSAQVSSNLQATHPSCQVSLFQQENSHELNSLDWMFCGFGRMNSTVAMYVHGQGLQKIDMDEIQFELRSFWKLFQQAYHQASSSLPPLTFSAALSRLLLDPASPQPLLNRPVIQWYLTAGIFYVWGANVMEMPAEYFANLPLPECEQSKQESVNPAASHSRPRHVRTVFYNTSASNPTQAVRLWIQTSPLAQIHVDVHVPEVVLALSPSHLHRIRFQPPLPDWKLDAIRRLRASPRTMSQLSLSLAPTCHSAGQCVWPAWMNESTVILVAPALYDPLREAERESNSPWTLLWIQNLEVKMFSRPLPTPSPASLDSALDLLSSFSTPASSSLRSHLASSHLHICHSLPSDSHTLETLHYLPATTRPAVFHSLLASVDHLLYFHIPFLFAPSLSQATHVPLTPYSLDEASLDTALSLLEISAKVTPAAAATTTTTTTTAPTKSNGPTKSATQEKEKPQNEEEEKEERVTASPTALPTQAAAAVTPAAPTVAATQPPAAQKPSNAPTAKPNQKAARRPSAAAVEEREAEEKPQTLAPTPAATLAPTVAPTPAATLAPTPAPTPAPTLAPTVAPTPAATLAPTVAATSAPASASAPVLGSSSSSAAAPVLGSTSSSVTATPTSSSPSTTAPLLESTSAPTNGSSLEPEPVPELEELETPGLELDSVVISNTTVLDTASSGNSTTLTLSESEYSEEEDDDFEDYYEEEEELPFEPFDEDWANFDELSEDDRGWKIVSDDTTLDNYHHYHSATTPEAVDTGLFVRPYIAQKRIEVDAATQPPAPTTPVAPHTASTSASTTTNQPQTDWMAALFGMVRFSTIGACVLLLGFFFCLSRRQLSGRV